MKYFAPPLSYDGWRGNVIGHGQRKCAGQSSETVPTTSSTGFRSGSRTTSPAPPPFIPATIPTASARPLARVLRFTKQSSTLPSAPASVSGPMPAPAAVRHCRAVHGRPRGPTRHQFVITRGPHLAAIYHSADGAQRQQSCFAPASPLSKTAGVGPIRKPKKMWTVKIGEERANAVTQIVVSLDDMQ